MEKTTRQIKKTTCKCGLIFIECTGNPTDYTKRDAHFTACEYVPNRGLFDLDTEIIFEFDADLIYSKIVENRFVDAFDTIKNGLNTIESYRQMSESAYNRMCNS